MAAYQKYILLTGQQVTQIFQTVASDFPQHGIFLERSLSPLGSNIFIDFCANEEEFLIKRFNFPGQLQVIFGESVGCEDKERVELLQLHFLAVCFQVRIVWSPYSW